MKKTLVVSLVFALAAPFNALAETQVIEAPSKIEAVTVFSDRAQVSRSARVPLKAGANLITITGLPRNISEESLRVEGKGNGRARIAGITVKKVFLERVEQKRVKELEDEIKSLNRKVESIEARLKGLVAQRTFIESIRVGWGERISKELTAAKPTTAEMNEAAKFVGDGIGKVEEQINDAEAAKKPLQDKIAALKKELEQSRADRMKEVRSVQVAIDADHDMAFNLDLSYLASPAHWEPTYDVRLSPDGKEAELIYRAQVSQRTGEDWPGVKLSLSTARPGVGGAPPELPPWHISFYEPPRPLAKAAVRYETFAAPPPPVPLMGAAPAEDSGAAPEQAMPMTAGVAEGQTSVLFQIRQPVDVPADGTRAGSVIAIEKAPVTAEYLTVPKLSPRVYLKSEVTNNTPYPLLAGEANVFNDTVFTGKSYLRTVSSGEKFDLYFGADDQIKVKRDVAKVRKKAGLMSSNSVSYRVAVELQNFKKGAVTVSLQDQLPLAGNAEIKVNLEEVSQKPDEAKADGTLVWKVGLAAGEKKKISYDIVIEYPKGRELTGIE
jgi:uncharacterized protein (TIGR02231 family)